MSDSAGRTVEMYEYDVYGNTIIRAPTQEPRDTSLYGNPYMFTGRRFDTETGLYYYRFRYYKPDIGRFLQTDPIGYYGGLNLYTYCGNNPLNWIDPFGLDKYRPWWAGPLEAIGAGAGWIYDTFHKTDNIRGPVGVTVGCTGGMHQLGETWCEGETFGFIREYNGHKIFDDRFRVAIQNNNIISYSLTRHPLKKTGTSIVKKPHFISKDSSIKLDGLHPSLVYIVKGNTVVPFWQLQYDNYLFHYDVEKVSNMR